MENTQKRSKKISKVLVNPFAAKNIPSIFVLEGSKYRSNFKQLKLLIQEFLIAFYCIFEIVKFCVEWYSLMGFEARLSLQKPLKVKLPTKFHGDDLSISENRPAANVLTAKFER